MTERDDRPASRPRSRRRAIWITVAAVLVVGLVIGLALFQPWKIFTRSTVDEAAPVAVAAATAPAGSATSPATSSVARSSVAAPPAGSPAGKPSVTGPSSSARATTAAADSPAPGAAGAAPSASAPEPQDTPAATEPAVLAKGTFVDGEHSTTGTASVLQLPDGSRYVRLEGFSTSDGPDVQVWVTDQQAGGDDWGKYDDGRYVELGTLKGTDGNQNYQVPADADLDGLTSVVIWCDRFNVAFGSAPIDV